MAARVRRALSRLWRALQQDRIRASAEEFALVRLRPGDWVGLCGEEYVVRASRVARGRVAHALSRAGRAPERPAHELSVPLAAPDRAVLLEPGGRARRVPAAAVVVYGPSTPPRPFDKLRAGLRSG